jgi:tetratricopeptide (TPR) repeat protein
MGEVWLGRHHQRGTPVAVKVLRLNRVRDPRFVFAFRNEVRASATLSHPAVVAIYDYGQVTREAEAAAEGRLPSESPYLVMELVRGGSLHPRCGRLPWRQVRATLVHLLDALSHAHARGVVHRDLKPSNVLLSNDFEANPWAPGAVKLCDFGLAHALDWDGEHAASGRVVGTPAFMAPEQLSGSWRDFGPWTDLYAVGCLAWAVVSGAPPFGWSPTIAEVRLAQEAPRLTLRPRTATPPGFVEWLSRLLEQDPARRFRRAADAAWALARLGDAGASEVLIAPDVPTPPEPSQQETLVLEDAPAPPEGLAAAAADAAPAPPLPSSWREHGPREGLLPGAGLGLFDMRAVPMVGREAERDRLWGALEAVVQSRRQRTVLLRGPAGCGKSRLARWLCERAHEVGAVEVLRATHAADGDGDGLGEMVRHHLRCEGLSREETRERLGRVLTAQGSRDPDEVEALTELVTPAAPGERHAVRLGSPTERHALVRRVIERAAAERPVILWLDDVHWGLDSLAFVSYLEATGARRSLPLLTLMTAEDEALAERDLERAVLAEVVSRSGARTVEVGPLSTADRQALMRGLLGLEEALAARVEERAGGNASYAVQLVRSWVQRGVLVPGERGFRLAHGARVSLPGDLHALWTARLEQLLEGRHPDDGAALELAAVLGLTVTDGEWRRACLHAGYFPAADLLDALLARRLARAEDGRVQRWSFSHAQLRECLEHRARGLGRLEAHHRTCAAVLEARSGAGVAERLGRHLLAAGAWRAALAPLSDGIDERLQAGDVRMAEALLLSRDRAMMQARLAPDDPLWGRGWLLGCRCARRLGRLDEAEVLAERAVQAAIQHGWGEVRARGLLEQGRLARKRGQQTRARGLLLKAVRLADAAGDRGVVARCDMELGWVMVARGDQKLARARFRGALSAFRAGGGDGEGWACLGLAVVARQAGSLDEAEGWLEAARGAFERTGSRAGSAECLQGLGEVARLRGQLSSAAEHYREALHRFRAIGAAGVIFPEIFLGLTLASEGDFQEGRRRLEAAVETLEWQGRQDFQGAVHAFLLPCVAAAGDWAAWDQHLDEAMRLLGRTGFVEVDVARMARLGGEIARASGERRRALAAWRLAMAQWTSLERAEEIADLRAAIAQLGL